MSESDCSEPRRRRSSRTLPQTKQPDPLICPRCQSTNTKFCYYNNYNKTQPRYFCKACKRHWTRGGILRNVPVGGGRKNKRLRWPEIAAAAAGNQETCKASFFTPISGEKNEDESYTDIDELKGLVSWDLYGSLIGCTVPEFVLDQDPPFSILLSSFDANPNSNNIQKSLMSWNDLESMGFEDLNKPWEDPTFKT